MVQIYCWYINRSIIIPSYYHNLNIGFYNMRVWDGGGIIWSYLKNYLVFGISPIGIISFSRLGRRKTLFGWSFGGAWLTLGWALLGGAGFWFILRVTRLLAFFLWKGGLQIQTFLSFYNYILKNELYMYSIINFRFIIEVVFMLYFL